MRNHCCVRVYANLDRVVEWRTADRLPEWLEYNSVYRFGNALFVDGECKGKGYLSQEQCEEQSKRILQELADQKLTPPGGGRMPSMPHTHKPAAPKWSA